MTCRLWKATDVPRRTRGPGLAAVLPFLLQGALLSAADAQSGLLAIRSGTTVLLADENSPITAGHGPGAALLADNTSRAGEALPDAPVADAAAVANARAAGRFHSSLIAQNDDVAHVASDDPQATKSSQQETTNGAVVTGVVSDLRGGLIPNAAVKLVNKSGTLTREGSSDAEGRYTFRDLPADSYTVTVSAPGLETIVLSDMPVSAGDRFEVPEVPLPLARTKADVEVFAGEEQVATEQLHIQEQQRVFGVFPNFYTSFIWDAAPLNRKQKFSLMLHSTLDPVQFGTTALIAGVEQATNRYPAYGQGVQGYAKRYGAAYADSFTGRFLGSALFPSIFGQDPRYFYQGTGTVSSRAWHAVSSAFICRGDSGHRQLYYSHILGNLSAGALSNLYHPGRDRGVGLTFGNAFIGLGASAGVNLVREFVLKGFTHKVPDYAKGKPTGDALQQ